MISRLIFCVLTLLGSQAVLADNGPIQITEESREHSLIEQTYEKVLLTPSGLSLCLTMQGEPIILKNLLGLSETKSQSLAAECMLKAVRLWGSDIEKYGVLGSLSKEKMSRRPKKSYYIVPESAEFPYDSWTDLENNTYISENAIHSDRLIYILIHELQMAFDSKDRLNQNNLGEIMDGWTGFSKSLFRPNVDQDLRKYLGIIHDSPLKRVFAVMRAFNFERAVLSETTDSSKDDKFKMLIDNERQCIQMAEIVIRSLQEVYSADELALLQSSWKKVRSAHIGLKYPARNIDELTLCQFMAIPSFASTEHLTEGPRPRIRPTTASEFEALKLNLSPSDQIKFQENLKKFKDQFKRNENLNNLNLKGDFNGKPSMERIKD